MSPPVKFRPTAAPLRNRVTSTKVEGAPQSVSTVRSNERAWSKPASSVHDAFAVSPRTAKRVVANPFEAFIKVMAGVKGATPLGPKTALGDAGVRALAVNPSAAGTAGDPLVIDGLFLDGGWVAPALHIADTKLHTVVRNSTFTRGRDFGVLVENAPNLTFEKVAVTATAAAIDPVHRVTRGEVVGFAATNSSLTLRDVTITGVGGAAGRVGYPVVGLTNAGDGETSVGLRLQGSRVSFENVSISNVIGGAGGAGALGLLGFGDGGDGGHAASAFGMKATDSELMGHALSINSVYAGSAGAGALGVTGGLGANGGHAWGALLTKCSKTHLADLTIAGVYGSAGASSGASSSLGKGGLKGGNGGGATGLMLVDSPSTTFDSLTLETIRAGAGAAGSTSAPGVFGLPGGEGGTGGSAAGLVLEHAQATRIGRLKLAEVTGGAGAASGAGSAGVFAGGDAARGGNGGVAVGLLAHHTDDLLIAEGTVQSILGAASGAGAQGGASLMANTDRGGDAGAPGAAFGVVALHSKPPQVQVTFDTVRGAIGSLGGIGGTSLKVDDFASVFGLGSRAGNSSRPATAQTLLIDEQGEARWMDLLASS